MSLSPGDKVGPYEILALVGTGGMGEVYRARDPRLGRDVAIKISAERFSERSEREARAIALLNHPNVCTLHDVGPNYLVMEFVDGPTLAGHMRKGRLPTEQILAISGQIADALAAAHDKGIVHRDLKPANIKITPGGTVKVLDFGLAKVCHTFTSGEEAATFTLTATEKGVILGTAPYMAPEQARGQPVDTRADIWAFGVVLYEMLTGRRPFHGETVTDLLSAIVKDEPDWTSVPIAFRRMVQSCLRKDPAQRLRHIGDAKLLIQGEEQGLEAPAKNRKNTATAAWILAAVSAIGAAVAVWGPWRAMRSVDPIRFQVQPTVNLASTGAFALSPNGRHIAYAGIEGDGIARIWIRSLDSLDDRKLTGTEMSTQPPPMFWSPDSRFIVFPTPGKLKKVDASGGAPQTLCKVDGIIIGGSWSPANVILIGSSSGGILRVPAEGGAPTPVTAPDPAQKETLHTFPIFLKDGRHFLYLKETDDAQNAGIYVGSLDSAPQQQSRKRILTTSTSVVLLPGRLLFERGSVLVTQEFDEDRFELKAQPIPVAEPVGAFLGFGFFSASRNGALVYRSPADEVQLAWFDRKGNAGPRVGSVGRYNNIALSPDGARAAISRRNPDQPAAWDLWLLDLVRGNNTRLTFGPARADSPVWSTDGSYVAYTSFGGGVGGLYRKLSNGAKEEETLLPANQARTPTSWSRDGRFLLFTQVDPPTGSDVWLLPLGNEAKPIRLLGSAFNESEARFSPSADWIAYTSNESGKNEVYVRSFSASAPGAIDVPKWLVSNSGGSHPLWRGDSKELFYISPDGKLMSIDLGSGSSFHAGVPKALFQLPARFGDGDVTRDGQRFLFALPAEKSTQSPFTVLLNWTGRLSK